MTRERAGYAVVNFEHASAASVASSGKYAYAPLRRVRIRVRMAVCMARGFIAHISRRLSFSFKANRVILRKKVIAPAIECCTKIPARRVSAAVRALGVKVAEGYRRAPGAVQSLGARVAEGYRRAPVAAKALGAKAAEGYRRAPVAAKAIVAKVAEGYRRASSAAKAIGAKAAEGHRGVRRVAAKPGVRVHILPVSVGAAAVCAIFFLSTLITSDLTYYEYSYKGKVLGVVKDETAVYSAIDGAESKVIVDEKAGAPVAPSDDKGLTVKKVIKFASSDIPVDGEDEIASNIAALKDVHVVGQAVLYGGERIGTVADDAEADRLLGLLKGRWADDEAPDRFSEIEFAEDVTQAESVTARKNIETADEVFARLERTSFAAIGVKTVEIVSYEEAYEEAPVCAYDKERYEDYELVITPGAAGYRKVTANRVRVNGEFVADEPTSYEVIRPAVAGYAIRGAKKLPDPIGSGKFIRPAEGGSISSPFGPRWGRMHEGVDIDIKYAPVYAAGDGKVVYTGNRGDGYGVMVLIDHGDGFETLYGHLSRADVAIGDDVAKGQRIATSGNTGRSTGAHLHFEVRVDGTPRNPLDYL